MGVEEKKCFNVLIREYGNEFADTVIDDWIDKDILTKLPLICNLLADDGKHLAAEILNSCKRMSALQNNVRMAIDNNFLITCFSEALMNINCFK